MAAAMQNVWHLRTVADTSSKACYVCYKPSTKVLITPDNKDYFYICPSHLTDKGFASPVVDEAAEKEKREKEKLKMIEEVKAELEEKRKKRAAKKESKKDDKDKDKSKDESEDKKDQKELDEKIKSIEDGTREEDRVADGPRIYTLHKHFYQMRLDRLRNMEIAKRNQQRMKDTNFFPSVPRGNVG